jgi:hypothetical protein
MTDVPASKLSFAETIALPPARNKGLAVDRRAEKGKPGAAFERITEDTA